MHVLYVVYFGKNKTKCINIVEVNNAARENN